MVEIKPMDEGYLHLNCLHDGPIDTSTLESSSDELSTHFPPLPWSDETLLELKSSYPNEFGHSRPKEFVQEMMHRYGTCAILAWEG